MSREWLLPTLTGLFNRRHFDYLAERELRRAVRLQRPAGMIMMDLDHFKQVNDLLVTLQATEF